MNAVHWVPFAMPGDADATTRNKKKLFLKVSAGLLFAAAAMAGIYALAATTATTAAAGFVDTERSSRARIVEFAFSVKQAAADYRTAQERCELIGGAESYLCRVDAKAEETRAKTRARLNYEGAFRQASFVAKPVSARGFDVVSGAALDVAPHRSQ